MKSKNKINRSKAVDGGRTFVSMRTWFDANGKPAEKDRIEGSRAFAAAIAGDLGEIAKCAKADYARRKFSQWGHFYVDGEEPDPAWNFPPFGSDPSIRPIPSDTEFRVYGYREHRPERDKTVVLVVDNKDLGEPVDDIWRCTYSPYLDNLRNKKRSQAKKRAQARKGAKTKARPQARKQTQGAKPRGAKKRSR